MPMPTRVAFSSVLIALRQHVQQTPRRSEALGWVAGSANRLPVATHAILTLKKHNDGRLRMIDP